MKKKNRNNSSPSFGVVTDLYLGDMRFRADEKTLHELQVYQIELEMQNDELHRIQTSLAESQDRYYELFEFAPVAYLTLTEQGLITEANITCSNLLGVEREQLTNHQFTQFVSPENSDCWHKLLMQIIERGGNQRCELALRRADGTPVIVNIDCLSKKTEGAPATVFVTLTDISARKQIEQLLRIAGNAFEMQSGILVADINKVILRVNQAFTRITGYAIEEVIGQQPSLLSSGRHDRHFYHTMWATVKREGYWQGEIWDKRKSGEIFPVWLVNTAITDDTGRVSYYVGSFTDITLHKQTELHLQVLRQQSEHQLGIAVNKLEQLRAESTEVKTALSVLLKQQNIDCTDVRHQIIVELKQTVAPFIEKLKASGVNRAQADLLNIIGANLQQVTQSYGGDLTFPVYQQLTPVEIQVASLIRQGLSTKTIAATLSLSPETISVHRKHIRKKLGLDSKNINLRSYLLTLTK
ncbi:PAS domain S-box protein (plasmid) [Methylomonas sp. 2BW1-5-20]|uniref:PAS domain S-box protein n=1 Tax=Methylomonas sp. 2BW1-5-20 TaxID=3376686 RepID=UPI00404CE62E